eukprot:10212130-Alexandrium_andersonii.AAC.1
MLFYLSPLRTSSAGWPRGVGTTPRRAPPGRAPWSGRSRRPWSCSLAGSWVEARSGGARGT